MYKKRRSGKLFKLLYNKNMGRGRGGTLNSKEILFSTQIGTEVRKPSPSLYKYKKQPRINYKTVTAACQRIFKIVDLEDDSPIVQAIGSEDFHSWLVPLDTAANHIESTYLNEGELAEDDSELLELQKLYEDEMHIYDEDLKIGQLLRPLFWGQDGRVFGPNGEYLELGDNQYDREFINQFFMRFLEKGEYRELAGDNALSAVRKMHESFGMSPDTHNPQTIENLHQQGFLQFSPDNSKAFQDLTSKDSVELTETTKTLQKYM